jgi:hypothetical protein
MTFSDDVQKGLIAGAFGLVGTLIPVFLSWSHDKDAVSSRMRKLDEATKKVAFWEQWLRLSQLICDPDSQEHIIRVKKELGLLAEVLEADSHFAQIEMLRQHGRSTAFEEKVQVLPFWRRLLLFYKPARSLAWFPRLFFFSGLFLAVLLLVTLFDPSKEFPPHELAITEFMLLIWMTIFRSLSQWLERPRATTSLASPVVVVAPPPKPS